MIFMFPIKKIIISMWKEYINYLNKGLSIIFFKKLWLFNINNILSFLKNNSIFIYIFKRHKEINIHGLTASILKCIKLALHIEKKFSDITLDVTTSSELTICDVKEVDFYY